MLLKLTIAGLAFATTVKGGYLNKPYGGMRNWPLTENGDSWEPNAKGPKTALTFDEWTDKKARKARILGQLKDGTLLKTWRKDERKDFRAELEKDGKWEKTTVTKGKRAGKPRITKEDRKDEKDFRAERIKGVLKTNKRLAKYSDKDWGKDKGTKSGNQNQRVRLANRWKAMGGYNDEEAAMTRKERNIAFRKRAKQHDDKDLDDERKASKYCQNEARKQLKKCLEIEGHAKANPNTCTEANFTKNKTDKNGSTYTFYDRRSHARCLEMNAKGF